MDAHRFDDLTKSLAAAPSRRQVVRTLVGGAGAGLLALLGRQAVAAKPGKVGVCHLTGDPANPVVYIQVDASSVAEHAGHGDAVAPDFLNDAANCGGCGVICAGDEACAGGACQPVDSCPICPGGHGCENGGCVCSSAGTCAGDDSTPCGLLHGVIPMGCEDGCCCVPSGLGGGVYPCGDLGDLNAPHPYCCSGWCGADGGCACIPGGTTDLYPCDPGPSEHCCSGWCGPNGVCA